MRITSIESVSTLTWGPSADPILALGTVAGALDASFSTSSTLDLYKLENSSLANIGSVQAQARFNRLAWASVPSRKLGILAGGLENGDLALWDPIKITEQKDSLLLSQSSHGGPVRGLDFNPMQNNLLASGATDGEIFIWDINNPSTPYSPGTRSPKLEDITATQWNRQVPHILATASNNGYTVIWDLRSRKELMQLAHPAGRKMITGVAWNNDNATQIATASDDDSNPVVLMWDLRNARAPERSMAGHTRGILSISWCPKDSDLLLSCGKDNRTIVWNTYTGEPLGDLHHSANWSYDVQWCSRNPDLIGLASFDGKVTVHSLMGTMEAEQKQDEQPTQPVQQPSDDPFAFSNVSQNISEPQDTNFIISKPPKWLRRPCSAVWGFGGKLVHFSNHSTSDHKSIVNVRSVPSEAEFSKRMQSLYNVVVSQDPNELKNYCAALAKSNYTGIKAASEKQVWGFLQALFEDGKSNVVEYLGFDVKNPAGALTPMLEKMVLSLPPEPKEKEEVYHGDSINGTQSPVAKSPEPKAPFKLFPKNAAKRQESDVDTIVTRSTILGDFSSAVDACFASDRLADAILLAVKGGPELLAKTQRRYFQRMSEKKTYIRVLQSITTSNLRDIVENVVLDSVEETWKDVVALISTHYNEGAEFQELLGYLGHRLENCQMTPGARSEDSGKERIERLSASMLCFLLSGDFVKVLNVWTANEKEFKLTSTEAHTAQILALQTLIEKVSIFRRAVQYHDPALEGTGEFPLQKLYDRYREYAVAVAQQGNVDFAWSIVQLVPAEYRQGEVMNDGLDEWPELRDRLYNCPDLQSKDPSQAPPPFPFDFLDYTKSTVDQLNASRYTATTASQNPYGNQQSYGSQQQQFGYGQSQQGYGGQQGYNRPSQSNPNLPSAPNSGFYPNQMSSRSFYPGQTQQSQQQPSYGAPSQFGGNMGGYGNTGMGPPSTNSWQSPPPVTSNAAYDPYTQQPSQPPNQFTSQNSFSNAPPSFQSGPQQGGGPNGFYGGGPGFTGNPGTPTPPPPSEPPKPVGHPPGDRSHIPPQQMPIVNALENLIKNTHPSASQKRQYNDSTKKVEILFDELNNGNVVEDVVKSLLDLAKFLEKNDIVAANGVLNEQFMARHFATTGKWLTGLKKLLHMALDVVKDEQRRNSIPSPGGPFSPPNAGGFNRPPSGGPPNMQGPPMGGPPMSQGPPMGGPPMGGPPMNGPGSRGPPISQGPPMGGPPMNGPPMGGPPTSQGPPMGGPPTSQGPPMGGPPSSMQGPPSSSRGPPMGGPPSMMGGPPTSQGSPQMGGGSQIGRPGSRGPGMPPSPGGPGMQGPPMMGGPPTSSPGNSFQAQPGGFQGKPPTSQFQPPPQGQQQQMMMNQGGPPPQMMGRGGGPPPQMHQQQQQQQQQRPPPMMNNRPPPNGYGGY